MKKEIITASPVKGELYMGVEIECLIKGRSLEIELGRIHDVYGDLITGKHDGTVAGNAEPWMPKHVATELVVQPMTLDCYQNRKWKVVFERALKPNGAWTSRLGGHIHMGLSAFTNKVHLYKYMKFIRTNIDYIKFIGERDFEDNSYCKAYQSSGKVVQQLLNNDKNSDRYEVLNLTNFGTLENRFFLTPFSREHLLKNVEWCHSLWEFTKSASLHFEVADFHRWLRTQRHKASYSNLLNFIGNNDSRVFVINKEDYHTVARTKRRTRLGDNETSCTGCGCEQHEDDTVWVDGEPYCTDCCFYCECCGENHSGDIYYTVDDETWCSYCFSQYATSCDCCGTASRSGSSRINVDWVEFRGQDMCERCRDNRDIFWCEDCEEYTEWEEGVCTHCPPSEETTEVEEETASPF